MTVASPMRSVSSAPGWKTPQVWTDARGRQAHHGLAEEASFGRSTTRALSRLCSVCAQTRAIKDCRQRVIDTIFKHLRVAAPRYERCRCGADRQPASPVSALIPGRALPELLGLQARLGARPCLTCRFIPDGLALVFHRVRVPPSRRSGSRSL
jgi:hypothetical protein